MSAHLRTQLASPPPGWHTFGSHVGIADIVLEFWGTDEGGMPLWERPKTELADTHESITAHIHGVEGGPWSSRTSTAHS